MSIECSVIIPAFQGAPLIADCIRSVQRALQGTEGEIVVVESSGDGTAELLRQYFPDVRLVSSPERLSVGAARNLGVSQARGELLFFVDQDCLVPPNWIDALRVHFRDPSVGATGGSIGVRDKGNLSGWGVYFLEFLHHFPQNTTPQRNGNFLLGCNLACRAEVFREAKFLDQTLGEDVLFAHTIRGIGFDVVYDPRVAVQHKNREGWAEFLRYNIKMGRAAARYHRVLKRPLIGPFLRWPLLVFAAPLAILPKILVSLLGSEPGYLLRYLLLLPVCLVGNLTWAAAFWKEARLSRDPVGRIR